jgi:hypothetical protein
MKNVVFWDVALCRLCVNRRFGGKYRLHLQGRKIRERRTSVSRWMQTELSLSASQKTIFFIITMSTKDPTRPQLGSNPGRYRAKQAKGPELWYCHLTFVTAMDMSKHHSRICTPGNTTNSFAATNQDMNSGIINTVIQSFILN